MDKYKKKATVIVLSTLLLISVLFTVIIIAFGYQVVFTLFGMSVILFGGGYLIWVAINLTSQYLEIKENRWL